MEWNTHLLPDKSLVTENRYNRARAIPKTGHSRLYLCLSAL